MDTVQNEIVASRAYRNGHCVGDVAIEDLGTTLAAEGTFVWVGLSDPSAALLERLRDVFTLHELTMEDMQKAHERPKVESYGDDLFIVLRTVGGTSDAVVLGETQVLVGANFVMSVRHGPSTSYAGVRRKLEGRADQLALGPPFVLYGLMDAVVDAYLPVAESLQCRFAELEEELFHQRFRREKIQELYELRREVMKLRLAAVPLLDVCRELLRGHQDLLSKKCRPYFRDVSDHVLRVMETTDNLRELLDAAMHANLALVTVGQNEIVKRLAGWGAVLAIPTMIFSLYGMNFQNMPELKWPYGYPTTLAVVTVLCVWLYRRLKRDGWL